MHGMRSRLKWLASPSQSVVCLAESRSHDMYKIHLENDNPPLELFGNRIRIESPPIKVVQTKEDAKRELQDLMKQGITRVYAVGSDWPSETSDELIDAHRS